MHHMYVCMRQMNARALTSTRAHASPRPDTSPASGTWLASLPPADAREMRATDSMERALSSMARPVRLAALGQAREALERLLWVRVSVFRGSWSLIYGGGGGVGVSKRFWKCSGSGPQGQGEWF
jgi:hypothetical protein